LEDLIKGKNRNDQEIVITLDQTKDPWGNEYVYKLGADRRPHVYCYGKDGKQGGTGEDRDHEWPEPETTGK
jgi:hypothetical protein